MATPIIISTGAEPMIDFLRKYFGSGISPDDEDCKGDLACETEKRLRELRKQESAFHQEARRSDPVDVARALLVARDRFRDHD